MLLTLRVERKVKRWRRAERKTNEFSFFFFFFSLSSPNSSVKWEEGSVFPEGWEEMDLKQKVVQGLYGERGFLYWLNWLSYRLVFVMIGGWITFRFIGPALHLYNLTNPFDISQVPL